MKEYRISISTDNDETFTSIIKELSHYDCDIHMDKEDKIKQYPFSYRDIAYVRLGERSASSPEQYKKDMEYYSMTGNLLKSFGISPKHKGFRYAIECIRIINTYGTDEYKMSKDIYPIISKWYDVSVNAVEHNVRNAICQAWNNNKEFTETKMNIFRSRPSVKKFLKYMADLINYSLNDA